MPRDETIPVPRDLLERILKQMEDDFNQIDGEWGRGRGDPDWIDEIRELRAILTDAERSRARMSEHPTEAEAGSSDIQRAFLELDCEAVEHLRGLIVHRPDWDVLSITLQPKRCQQCATLAAALLGRVERASPGEPGA